MGEGRKETRDEIACCDSRRRAGLCCACPGLTALAGVCYFAPTLRRRRDLSRGTKAFAKQRALVGRRGFRTLRVCCWSLLFGATACGPIGYLQQVHGKARDAVTEARRAGAESAAPYQYTSAVEYLKKAEEEGDYAEYQIAIEYGRQAESFAKRAREIATAGDAAGAADGSEGPGAPPSKGTP